MSKSFCVRECHLLAHVDLEKHSRSAMIGFNRMTRLPPTDSFFNFSGVPAGGQQKRIQLGTVRSLAFLSGLRILRCCGCGVGWPLYLRFAPLAWEPPYALGPSRVCDLCHSSWQPRILNLLSKAGDQTLNLMVPSQIRFHCATRGAP